MQQIVQSNQSCNKPALTVADLKLLKGDTGGDELVLSVCVGERETEERGKERKRTE